jgi:hypothetical protein
MTSKRRLGVLGTLVWDTIWTLDDVARGEPFTSWGGVAYSFAGAAAACPPGWEVVPIVKVGTDLEEEARRFLATLPSFAVGAGVMPMPVENNRVELRYTDAGRRGERQSGGIPAWEWDELEPHLAGLDALFVNFISGFELTLATVERLRASFHGPLYTDLHSLFLGCPGKGAREWRRLPEWERWVACFDAVQLNEDEVATLAEPGESTADVLGRMLAAGTGLVALTMGPRGAAYAADATLPSDPMVWDAWRRARSADPAPCRTATATVPPETSSETGDPTGCGDVWGVTLFSSLLAGLPLEDAIRAAHRAASRKLHHRGATGLYAHLVG